MALHRFQLPPESRLLWQIVGLQHRVFVALCNPTLARGDIDTDWLRGVWPQQDPGWVYRFSLGGNESPLLPLRIIARAPLGTRQFILEQFRQQIRVRRIFDSGGAAFRQLPSIKEPGGKIAQAVQEFCKCCYDRLGHNTQRNWQGYVFTAPLNISKSTYKIACSTANAQRLTVCPYCDGQNNDAELDHYYPQSRFPFLSCLPQNLVPVCSSCNDAYVAKGDDAPLTAGPPQSTDDWLHPLFRPASDAAYIEIAGPPTAANVELRSPDPAELRRLQNHFDLIKTLGQRWRTAVVNYWNLIPGRVRLGATEGRPQLRVIASELATYENERGREPHSMVRAAVCRAIQNNRAGYQLEIDNPNPPKLVPAV
jgi:hypothetical protein